MKKILIPILIIISSFVSTQQKIYQEKDFITFIKNLGAAKAIEFYREFKKINPDSILFNRKTINNLGWETAAKGDIDEAIKLFELNILAYPDHYDSWDSYAEAILIRGGNDYIETVSYTHLRAHETSQDLEIPEEFTQGAGSQSMNSWRKRII